MVRAADCAGRFGGDEFVILVHGDHEGGTRRLAERLIEALKEPFSVKGYEIIVSASVGFAVFPDHGEQAKQLLRAADMAMYQVKKSGKGGIRAASLAEGIA
jgi:diguanylate cyclase (GGDEF)-like protein